MKSRKDRVYFTTDLGCSPRNLRNYDLRHQKAIQINHKRRETVVGSHSHHIPIIIAVIELIFVKSDTSIVHLEETNSVFNAAPMHG